MKNLLNKTPVKGLTDEPFGTCWQTGRGESSHKVPSQQQELSAQQTQQMGQKEGGYDSITEVFNEAGGQLSNAAHRQSACGIDRART